MFVVMNNAIGEIRATKGSSSRMESTFCGAVERMMNELNHEVGKL